METYNNPYDSGERKMTYQVAMRGSDGLVLASDTREYLEGGGKRRVRKIQIDPSGRFAWAYAGRQFSSLVASSLREEFVKATLLSGEDIARTIRELSTELLPDKVYDEKLRSTILWIDGPARKAYRTELLPQNLSISNDDSMWTAGFTSQFASLIPEHFFDENMNVDKLAAMAAYTVWLGSKIEPTLIGGLDIAVYRYSEQKFSFVDSAKYLKKAKELDTRIRGCFAQV